MVVHTYKSKLRVWRITESQAGLGYRVRPVSNKKDSGQSSPFSGKSKSIKNINLLHYQ